MPGDAAARCKIVYIRLYKYLFSVSWQRRLPGFDLTFSVCRRFAVLSSMIFPIYSRRDSHFIFKQARKTGYIDIAALYADVVQVKLGFGQKLFCAFYAQLYQITAQRLAGGFPEIAAQGLRGYIKLFRKQTQRELLVCDVLLDTLLAPGDQIIFTMASAGIDTLLHHLGQLNDLVCQLIDGGVFSNAEYIGHMFSINTGWVNGVIRALGGTPVHLMGEAEYYRHVYVWSGIWQGMGWGSIIYLAALTGIDPGLHEAAMIDGAGKLRRIWHIDLPGIMPTVAIMLIMRFGSMMSSGFDKAYIMQNSMNISVSEVISTYVYEMGMKKYRYSYSSAIGLFNNVINFVLLTLVNRVSAKLSGNSLW